MKARTFKAFASVTLSCLLILLLSNLNDLKLTFSTKIKEKIKNNINNTAKLIEMPKDDGKVLCIIMTSDSTLIERCPTVWDTWAKKCDKAIFACNCANVTKILKSDNRDTILQKNDDYKKILDLPMMQLEIAESYDFMAEKAMVILEKVYKQYSELFNWFLLVDDDTFVFLENLRTFIANKSSTEPYTYGYNFKEIVSTGYHSGGGGILFTHESLKRIYNSIQAGQCNFKVGYGDIAIGECSRISDVKIGYSLDANKRERFHTLSYGSHSKGYFPEWIYKYSANIVKKGKECCSEDSITFHYTPPNQMRRLANLKNPRNLSELFSSFF
jgi:hypothetical protein